MKPNAIPIACGCALTLMCAVVATHWMSVRQMVDLADATRSSVQGIRQCAITASIANSSASENAPKAATTQIATTKRDSPSTADQEKIDKLLRIVENLAHQNQDLREQVGETNRDLMELQFRVDTHSESFRPLRATQNPETAYDQSPGVLPPREQH